MADAITATGLVKRYGSVTAPAGVDLSVPEGTVLGLLGPNGAGKTTIVRILATLLRPDEGTAQVAGVDVLTHPRDVRRRIGLSGQYAAVDEYLWPAVVDEHRRSILVPVSGGTGVLVDALRRLDSAQIALDDVGVRRRPAADARRQFLSLTGKPAEENDEEAGEVAPAGLSGRARSEVRR